MNEKIRWINGLKGILILGIILTHYPRIGSTTFDSLADDAGGAVQFFFVISGFFMFKSLNRTFGQECITINHGAKWILKKLVRLAPLYYMAIVAEIIIFRLGEGFLFGSQNSVSIANFFFHFCFFHLKVPLLIV